MDGFRDYLYRQGLADRTIREYDKWARRVARWCWSHRLDINTLTAEQIRTFADSLPVNQSSQKAARATLKHYYTYISRDDHPWMAIKVPPRPRMQSRALSPEQSRMLRDAAVLVGGRKGLALLIGLYTAARASEIAGMRWDGWQGDRLRFARPKNRDVHTVPVHPTLATHLDGARDDAWSEWMFPGHGRPHVGPGTVWQWVRDIAETVGIGVTTHQLRHVAITTALEATHDVQAVMELAGHRNPTVTMGYARLSDERLEAAVAALDY